MNFEPCWGEHKNNGKLEWIFNCFSIDGFWLQFLEVKDLIDFILHKIILCKPKVFKYHGLFDFLQKQIHSLDTTDRYLIA